MRSLRVLLGLLGSKDRLRLGILVLAMVLGALLEVVGIGLLFPFVAILQNQEPASVNRYLHWIYSVGGFTSPQQFSAALGATLLAIFVIKGIASIAISNAQLRFVYAKQVELGGRVLAGYLYRPYSFFLGANSSTLIGNLTTSVGQVCSGVMQSALALASELMILVGLVAILIGLGSGGALLVLVLLVGLGVLFVKLVKSRIARDASENDVRWKGMIRAVNESISGAKEVKVLGRESYFVDAFVRESSRFVGAVRRNAVLSQVPRAVLETAAVAGMVLVSLFAVISGRFQEELFPLLAVLAVATVRLVPSANRILQSWNGIRFYEPAIEIITAALLGTEGRADRVSVADSRACLEERLSIRVKRFSYQGGGDFGLRDVHIEVERGESVALIGRSGSGKTTLVDLILGLFPDFEGEILADGTDIRSLGEGWHRRIGYIPQSIYLSDDTVVRNVAFGVPEEEISLAQVERALKLAGLEHVVETLPEGLETIVGDDGIRLSGGERQRIGIARALYHDPDLLILDEATSALDNETEHKIVDAILGLTPAKTIIVVAHRLSTVGKCDRVYLMAGGRVVDSGGFDQLAARHPEFVNPQGEESR